MATINSTGRPAYMYQESTDTWWQISGIVSTGANYQWVGTHQFDNNTTLVGTTNIIRRFNSFLNATARAAVITDPQIGLITFIQQDGVGATINRFEYWNGTAWIPYADPATTVTLTGTQTLTNKTLTSPAITSPTITTTITTSALTSYTIGINDASRILEFSASTAITVTIPPESTTNFAVGSSIVIVQTGSGQITVSPGVGVTLNGTPGFKTRTQWSLVSLIKRGANLWIMAGDSAA